MIKLSNGASIRFSAPSGDVRIAPQPPTFTIKGQAGPMGAPGDTSDLATREDVAAVGADVVAVDASVQDVLAALLSTLLVHVDNPTDVSALATQTTLAGVLSALQGTVKTQEQSPLNLSALATQATLAAVLAKLSADPATQTTLAQVLAALGGTVKTQEQAPLNLSALQRDATGQALLALLAQLPPSETLWREDFDGSSIDPTLWTITDGSAGRIVPVVAGGVLTIPSGTTSGDTWKIRSKTAFRLPFKVRFTLLLSQRIVNQQFIVQVTNADGSSVAAWVFDATTVANGKVRATHAGVTAVADTVVVTVSSSVQAIHTIDLYTDAVDFNDQAADTSSNESPRQTRTRSIPAPDEDYFVEIIATNTGAAASNTNFVIDQVTVEDRNKVAVDVIGGRGNTNLAHSVPINGTVSITAGVQQIGFTKTSGIWFDDTSTTLAANAVFTGTSRDTTLAATATQLISVSTYAQEFRICATADVAGTLYLEVSRDNVTWRRIKSVALAAAAGTGTVFYGEIIHRPSTRYARLVFVNGPTIQAAFMAQTFMLGA